ncbi:hypothetical protein V497_05310 [Pseudogymnoascus sp. VKM F-4516 (FW-969)]|nr:hypothetical protein V497_05310 [Pseudogymnoascus sp. VKM F-4516 (FW-969)]
MFISTIIIGLIGLSHIPIALTLPTETNSVDITHIASDYFPNAKRDLTRFNVDARYAGYSAETRSWLASIDPSSGKTDEEKAILILEAAYAHKFDPTNPDMAADLAAFLAAVAGNGPVHSSTERSIERRSSFQVSVAHAVKWASCAGVFSCLSGTTCTFSIDIGKAPRSHCQEQGGSNCCISWSNYNVRAGFFSTTWTACNSEVQAEHKSDASCEGYGTNDQGGDVCLSNRANGCT